MIKNTMLLVLLLVLFLGLSGCNGLTSTTTAAPLTVDSTTVQATATIPTTLPETTVETTTPDPEQVLLEMTSLELQYYLGNGTNLGNTMEAYGKTVIGIDAEISEYETIWGQPITTAEMLVGMKAAGFDTIRIPVAWTNTMDYENGDYTINPAYISRVGEIVGYALDAGMYVIINDHWDGGWWGMFSSATPATVEAAWDLYEAMWTQVGTYFKDYSYRLIFESANEELGSRLNDVHAPMTEDSGTLSEAECYQMANAINQEFVNIVRSLGGKNEDRFLLIAGYNTDIQMTNDSRFEMPEDTASDKLLLSVHYYTPWTYCGSSGDASWGTENHYNTMNELLEMMTNYTDQGYGIIIGEWGVLTRSDGSLKKNTIEFTTNFLDNCDLYGYAPMLWDTNAFFIRTEGEIFDEELAQLYQQRSFNAQAALSPAELATQAQTSMAANLAIAIENDLNNGGQLNGDEEAVAWIMYTSSDWSVTYSVGDYYDPTLSTAGIVATDVLIEEAGTFTIGLDFTGTEPGFANGVQFSAIGISNGELLFPGYIINITEFLVNGEAYSLTGFPYTSSDDGVCTRMNLYNAWVSKVPDDARMLRAIQLPYASPTVLDPDTLVNVYTIQITFQYLAPSA